MFVGTLTWNAASSSLQEIKTVGGLSSEDWRHLIQATLLFASFLNWAGCVRAGVHVGFLLCAAGGRVPTPAADSREPADGGAPPLSDQPLVGAAVPASSADPGDEESASRVMTAALVQRGRSMQGLSPESGGARASVPRQLREAASRQVHALLTPLEACAVTERAEVLLRLCLGHFSLGWRCIYLAIPPAFAVAGAEALIVSSALIAVWLLYIDYAAMVPPRSREE